MASSGVRAAVEYANALCECGHRRDNHIRPDKDLHPEDREPAFCGRCPGYTLEISDGIDVWERAGSEFSPPIGAAWHPFKKRGAPPPRKLELKKDSRC